MHCTIQLVGVGVTKRATQGATSVYRSNFGKTSVVLVKQEPIAPSSHPHQTHPLSTLFSLSTMSTPNLQLIREALDTYAEQMKIDLKDNPFAEEVKGCDTPEAILQLLEKNRDEFKEYREKNRKFIDCLDPVVKFVHAFSNVLGEVTSLVSAD